MSFFKHAKKEKVYEKTQEKDFFYAPIKGFCKDISESDMAEFRDKSLGDGVLILPEDNKIYAPVECTIAFIFPDHNALGLKTAKGTELFLHIGSQNSKNLGDDFLLYVAEDQQVTKGQLLAELNLSNLKNASCAPSIAMIVTNLSETQNVITKTNQNVTLEDIIFQIR